MKSITVKNLCKSFQGKTLFEDVSFSVQKGDRIAITGKNGAGKSTLLKIILGTESSDSGRVIREKVSILYIPQEFSGNEQQSIMDYLDTSKATGRVFDIIKQFKVIGDAKLESSHVHELSGGQKRILEIASALSKAPMFLLIDEPENHLDIKSRAVLTEMLQRYWGGVLFVSHDRHLVNQVSNKIVSIEDETAVLMTGKSYEEFMAIQRQNILGALNSWKAEAREVKKMEANVRMLKARTRYNDSQAKTYQMKKRQLEERREALGKRPDHKKHVRIDVAGVERKTGKLVFNCTNMDFSYDENMLLLEKINLDFRFGEKVVLLGRNGSGKTTLLKLLRGQINPTSGNVRIGNEIKIKYIDQTSTLDKELSPLEHFYSQGYAEEHARSLMAQFLFTQNEAESALKNLSGGQQQRFIFLFTFKTAPECLILDEPTNNLDPETWELLLRLVNEYSGSLLLVTHDRTFIEQMEQKRMWVLHNKTIKESWSELDDVLRNL